MDGLAHVRKNKSLDHDLQDSVNLSFMENFFWGRNKIVTAAKIPPPDTQKP